MHRSVRLAENQAKPANEAQMEPGVKKKRSDDGTSNIATLDNGTLVEAFNYLNYMQLAKSSLVSKRFSNLIRNNRHRLAILYVDYINMIESTHNLTCIKMYGKELSPIEYNEWVIRNGYSKEITMEGPAAEMRSRQYGGQVYWMRVDYNDSKCSNARTTVLSARVELSHYNWPLFQHFVRLLTDPSIYINYLRLTPLIHISFVNLLAEAINLDSSRIQCGTMVLYSYRAGLEDNVQKFIGWTKNHVLCKEFRVSHESNTNFDEEMLDFLMTGAHCTFAISINRSDISNVIVAFLQKFMDLKECDENQMIESIRCYGAEGVLEALNRVYAKLIDKEEKGKDQCIELFNNRIGKKLKITARITAERWIYFVLDIKNL
ncbi:hypothetical protein DdX_21878 [Ditylenchus destructor]|uniref:F-box domain-containing protein n=1 Tax=Ditylenchus destructor TaxID=166010 RepID=A0AAD4MIY3_9BILA|nr:hypothetical protein DdX_21878 [Ditylenchus destructor]